MPDVRIVNEDNDANDRPIAVQVRSLTRANAVLVAQVNVSGDIVNPGGAGGSGGDGAIQDGANSAIEATVRDYTNSNPLAVVLTNVSGDTYNASTSGGGGDGAIQDGADSTIEATVLQSPTGQPGTGDNPLLVQIADDSNRHIGRITGPVGIQAVGGSLGGRVSISGDSLNTTEQNKVGVHVASGQIGVTGDISVTVEIGDVITVGRVTAPIGISGDVSTFPRVNDIWPVRQASPIAVSVTGDSVRTSEQNIVGVNIVGGSAGGRVSISGDSLAVTATDLDIRNINPEQDSVRIHGGVVGITGDVNITVEIGDVITVGRVTAPIGISGDISTFPRAGDTWQVREQGQPGVQILGGQVGGRVGITGDVNVTATNLDIRDLAHATDLVGAHQKGAWSTAISGDITATNFDIRDLAQATDLVGSHQKGAWASSITGDVSLQQNSNRIIGRIESPISVQVAGYSGTAASQSITGDVNVTATDLDVRNLAHATDLVGTHQKGAWGVQISGDSGVLATVRDYTNANPIAVALTNASGDTFSPVPKEPICATIPFRVTSAGTTTLAGPYNGRVIKVCSYDLQAEADTAQCYLGSGASGSQMTTQWLLGIREGVAKQVAAVGGGYIFKTLLNQALVIENAGANVRGSITFHTGDSF